MTSRPSSPSLGGRARDLVFTPTEVATEGRRYLEWREASKHLGFPTYIPGLDARYLPLMPPEHEGVLGLSSHFKTGFQNFRARRRAEELAAAGLTHRAVVQISWEDTVEQMNAFHLAALKGIPVERMARGDLNAGEWRSVTEYSIARIGLPLWVIAPSLMRDQDPADMTLDVVEEALHQIVNWGGPGEPKLEIDVILGDYLQEIPLGTHWTRGGSSTSVTLGLKENSARFKKLGRTFRCATSLTAQVPDEVEKDKRLPRASDTEWYRGYRQRCDRMLVICYPHRLVGRARDFLGVAVTETDVVFAIPKQKLSAANQRVWAKVNPALNTFGDAEVRTVDLRGR